MFGRLFPVFGLCTLLWACSGNYKKLDCAADGGCAKAPVCRGKSCKYDAAVEADGAAHTTQASNRADTRSQAVRVSNDAGTASTPDSRADTEPSQPDEPSKGGEVAAVSSKKSAAGQGGAGVNADAAAAACEQGCGSCQACDDQERCQPVTGRDDADSCSDTHTCSSRGACLRLSEAQVELGEALDYAELTQSYAQVLTFSEPATVQEIRLEVACNENDQTFPAIWIAAAPGGMPTNTIIATANALYQAPTDSHAFALLELSRTIEEPATGPIAIVAGETDKSCSIRINKQAPYRNGSLFSQTETLWSPSEGSMVFQVLSSQ